MIANRIIWHHSADTSRTDQFDRVNAYHKTRAFPLSKLGYYVGYHYFIERDGTLWKAREENEIGAHDAGENINSIGICLAGNFNVEEPSEEQARTLAALITDVRTRHNIPINRIEPHRWDDDTDCPGTKLPDSWAIQQYLTREKNVAFRLYWSLSTYLKLL